MQPAATISPQSLFEDENVLLKILRFSFSSRKSSIIFYVALGGIRKKRRQFMILWLLNPLLKFFPYSLVMVLLIALVR